jgi:assimilatory nitrate reductase catalytic subunit
MAFTTNPEDWSDYVRTLAGTESEPVVYCDTQTGRMRFACYEDGYLVGTVFLAPEPVAVSREWAISQLVAPNAARGKRSAVLAGRPCVGNIDRGATVCACFGIGANEIAAAVARGCGTVAAVGEATQAGTNCGSCRAEIRNIIDRQRAADTTAPGRLVATG